uniref:Uncharacterized protein n=1 Tax=Amphimedon queenslandica TaxID=400682 RepID=A0A1X7V226_AMPQE
EYAHPLEIPPFSKFCFQEPRHLPLHCHEDRKLVSVNQNQVWWNNSLSCQLVMLQLECG